MTLSELVDVVEQQTNVDSIINTVLGNFEDYPHLQKGFESFMGDNERYDFEDFQQNVINILNEIDNFSDDEFDALEMAIDDQGPWYFEDTVDIINRGDYIYFPGVSTDEELGKAYIDMIGSVEDAIDKSRLTFYIDIDEVADTFQRDAELSGDEESEDWDHDTWYDIAAEMVENNPEEYVDDYFDYDAYGRDLRIEGGWYFGDLGAISIQ